MLIMNFNENVLQKNIMPEYTAIFLFVRFSLNLMMLNLPSLGCQFKTSYGMKDMERHLRTHTGLYSCYIFFLFGFLLLAFHQKVFSCKITCL